MSTTVNIGRPFGHVEGSAKVTGRAKYTADINSPGMLWAKCLRSPYPHARIISIDISRATRLPGVHTVLTGTDIPDLLIGRWFLDTPVLARKTVRFIGEKIAAVAAETPEIAEAALQLINVDYEELPAVFDPIEAMQPNAPVIHDHPAEYGHPPLPPSLHSDDRIAPPIRNVIAQVTYSHGDIKTGFAQAERVFEHTFVVPPVHQGFIEPHACVAQVESGGQIRLWMSHKMPFQARSQIAAALDLPEARIRVDSTTLGGDFGGKGSLMDSVLCYYLARASGRPVKMVMTYTEELMAGNPRHSAVITHRTGVTRDGRITARYAKEVFNTGAYASFIPMHMLHGAGHAGGAYRVPHIQIEAFRVYTNTVPRGHMRSPGAPQTIFTVESHLDIVAHELGLDPLEFRLRNVLTEGDSGPLGEKWSHIRGKETLEAAATAAEWNTDKPHYIGRGVAMYERQTGAFGPSSATISVDAEGKITLLTGLADTGTGSLTVLQQMVAEELQAPFANISTIQGDTDSAGYETGAGGSRLTHTAGTAAINAAREIKQELYKFAAHHFKCDASQIEMKDGRFVTPGGQSLDLPALMASASDHFKLPVSRTHTFIPTSPDDSTCFAAQIAEVEVDPETGQVKLRKVVTSHDTGTIINPLTHQGQIEGGVVQAIGQAITEHIIIRDGAVTNLHLGDYKLPTSADIPELDTILVKNELGPIPFGGKAIGEHSNVALPAAIANAVFDAVGIRLMDLPVTAEKVYTGLRQKEQGTP